MPTLYINNKKKKKRLLEALPISQDEGDLMPTTAKRHLAPTRGHVSRG